MLLSQELKPTFINWLFLKENCYIWRLENPRIILEKSKCYCQWREVLYPQLGKSTQIICYFQQHGTTTHPIRQNIERSKFIGRIISSNSRINWPLKSGDFRPLDHNIRTGIDKVNP